MSSVIPQTLFVIRPGVSQRDAVKSSLDRLERNGATLVGLIVNDVKSNSLQKSYPQTHYFSLSHNNNDKNEIVVNNN